MKTALIIGVTGNFGLEMAKTLNTRGWRLKVLLRDASKAPSFIAHEHIVQGSARDESTVKRASKGVDMIVYAANPQYHQWHEEALQMLEPTVKVAQANKLQILFPGNVYHYAPQEQPIDEDTKMSPPTDKGDIRMAMEARLKQAANNGARVLIVRAGDFLGPKMHMSWLDFMVKRKGQQVSLAMPHSPNHRHFWSYLPDLCTNAVLLAETTDSSFEVFHDTGFVVTTRDWQQAIKQCGYLPKVKGFPWWLFKLVTPFNPVLREVFKMRYLWQETVILDGKKMEQVLGPRRQQTLWNNVVKRSLLKETEDRNERGVPSPV